jgi:hypothetical protein
LASYNRHEHIAVDTFLVGSSQTALIRNRYEANVAISQHVGSDNMIDPRARLS